MKHTICPVDHFITDDLAIWLWGTPDLPHKKVIKIVFMFAKYIYWYGILPFNTLIVNESEQINHIQYN